MKHRDLLVLIANERENRAPQTDAFTSAEVADHIWSCLLDDAMAYAQYRCWKAILSPHEPLSKEHIEKLAEKTTLWHCGQRLVTMDVKQMAVLTLHFAFLERRRQGAQRGRWTSLLTLRREYIPAEVVATEDELMSFCPPSK